MLNLKTKMRLIACILLVGSALFPPTLAFAEPAEPLRYDFSQVTAADLISAMNVLRTSYGLQALIEDPIINAVAQSTAQTMADNLLSWHIGDVAGRLAAAGYGGGSKVWATENFAIGYDASIDEIMVMWSDESHMLPAVNPYYCNIGAGTAQASNGSTYYVLQAAYVSGQACDSNTSPVGPVEGGGFGIIVPVTTATPDATGKIVHVVKSGQSFWAIAVAYQTTIKEILRWNNLPEGTVLQIGQELVIPNPKAEGYMTPTPFGYFIANPPDVDGKIVHTVQAYQNLSIISEVYGVPIERILELNSLTIDMPLQIGQKLLIYPGNVTPTPTPRPLTPIEMLTPAADGNYYHIVKEGQNFSWIASYYGISLADLLAWNNLTENYVPWPGEKLLLKVTPPATITPTPTPVTPTPIPSPTLTSTPTPTLLPNPTSTATPEPTLLGLGAGFNPLWLIPVVIILGGGGYLALRSAHKKSAANTPSEQTLPIDDSAKVDQE
jgi:LysM repeat protein